MYEDEAALIFICVAVIFWIGLGMIGFLINRRPLCFWLGFLFGPFGLLISAVIYVGDRQGAKEVSNSKRRYRRHRQPKSQVPAYACAAMAAMITVTTIGIIMIRVDRQMEIDAEIAQIEYRAEQQERARLRAEERRRERIAAEIAYQNSDEYKEKQRLAKIEADRQLREERIEAEKERRKREIQLKIELAAQERQKEAKQEAERQRKIDLEEERKQREREIARKDLQQQLRDIEERQERDRYEAEMRTYQRKVNRLVYRLNNGPDNWETAKEYIETLRVLSKQYPLLEIPDIAQYDVYTKDEPIEVVRIKGNNNDLVGVVKSHNGRLDIITYLDGKPIGGPVGIHPGDILERRLATPEEWEETKEKDEDTQIVASRR